MHCTCCNERCEFCWGQCRNNDVSMNLTTTAIPSPKSNYIMYISIAPSTIAAAVASSSSNGSGSKAVISTLVVLYEVLLLKTGYLNKKTTTTHCCIIPLLQACYYSVCSICCCCFCKFYLQYRFTIYLLFFYISNASELHKKSEFKFLFNALPV